VRLPAYHCHFNPIEYIWSQIKPYIGKENGDFTVCGLIRLTKEAVARITPNLWFSEVEHCRRLIQEAGKTDLLFDKAVDSIIINLGEDSDSEDDPFWDNDEEQFEDKHEEEHVMPAINFTYDNDEGTEDDVGIMDSVGISCL